MHQRKREEFCAGERFESSLRPHYAFVIPFDEIGLTAPALPTKPRTQGARSIYKGAKRPCQGRIVEQGVGNPHVGQRQLNLMPAMETVCQRQNRIRLPPPGLSC